MSAKLLIVTYHYIRDRQATRYPGIHPFAAADFAAQVQDLRSRYHMATPEQAERFLLGQGDLPGPSVLLAFDDGLVDQGKAARAVLDPLGIRAAFFVTSRPLLERTPLAVHKVHWLRAHTEPQRFREEFDAALPAQWRAGNADAATLTEAARQYPYDAPEDALLKSRINSTLPNEVVDDATAILLRARNVSDAAFCAALYMGEADLRALAGRGHCIGAHGHSHAAFSRLGAGLDADLARNVQCLAAVLGAPPTWVSYPYGRAWAIPADAPGMCRRHGFRVGVTLNVGWNEGTIDPALVKRINTNELAKFA